MHKFTIDENKDKKFFAYKRHFISGTPRLIVQCRAFGHKSERVDLRYNGHYYQCKRCGARPVDQTTPRGPWQEAKGGANLEWWVLPKKRHDSASISFRIGSSSSERGFKGHVTTPVASVYWGLEGYGERWRRLINPDPDKNYESREFQLAFHDGKIWTKIYGKTNSWSRSDPKWQQMSWSVSDFVFGKRVNTRETIETEHVVIPMTEGGYPATAKLERFTSKRKRARTDISYCVDIKIDEPARFIPVPGKGESSYDCGDDGVWELSGGIKNKHDWVAEAISMMVNSALRDRERYASRDWTPDAGWSEGLVKA